jgi:hypothetical protein
MPHWVNWLTLGVWPPFSYWPTFVTRLAQPSVLSIAKVRGRARAQGFAFALACDMRFASRERAFFALVEVAGASVPGGGGVEWLTALIGRSRAPVVQVQRILMSEVRPAFVVPVTHRLSGRDDSFGASTHRVASGFGAARDPGWLVV